MKRNARRSAALESCEVARDAVASRLVRMELDMHIVAEELTSEDEKRHALRRIMAQYHQEDFPFSEGPLPRTRIFRLQVRKRTGKARTV